MDRTFEECTKFGNEIPNYYRDYLQKLEEENQELLELIVKADHDECGCLGGLLHGYGNK